MSEVVEGVELDGGVLVGYDGSGAAGQAVRWAADLAARLGVRLHILRAWGLVNAPRPRSQKLGYVAPLADYEAAVRDDLATDIAKLDLACDLEIHVVHGRASGALLAAAAGAEMVVVGKRGWGGFRGLAFGSTADQVMRNAPCPVIVVPVDNDDE